MLGHRIWRIGWNMNHMDLSESGLYIHVVVTGGTQGDDLYAQFIQPVNDRRIHVVVHKNTDRVATPGQVCGILVQFCFQKTKLHVMLAAIVFKRRFVVIFCIVKRDFDHVPASASWLLLAFLNTCNESPGSPCQLPVCFSDYIIPSDALQPFVPQTFSRIIHLTDVSAEWQASFLLTKGPLGYYNAYV